MDTDQLAAFERIVREGSFSRAARALNIAQPSISARMQALEREVGGPLFLRSGRKITLTERGENFLPYARRTLAVLAEGVEAAQGLHSTWHGRLTIGTIESLTGGFLASALARYHASHPQVEIFVRTGHSNQVVEMLYDGIIKLGLISWPYFNSDLAPLLHFREPLVLVVPPGHPFVGRGPISMDDIQRHGKPLLLVQWGPVVNEFLAQIHPQPGDSLELPIHTIRVMLLHGTGIALLTRTLVEDDLAQGRLFEIAISDLPAAFREGMLVQLHSQRKQPAIITDFSDVLREEAGRLCVLMLHSQTVAE